MDEKVAEWANNFYWSFNFYSLRSYIRTPYGRRPQIIKYEPCLSFDL